MSWWTQHGDAVRLTLHIQPGAKKTEIAGEHGDALKIRLAAPPVDGKANAALLSYLAQAFDVPQRQVTLKQGDTSRRKVVEISGSRIAPASLLP
jgi:uncharacterized protein (TIGR00251 family)